MQFPCLLIHPEGGRVVKAVAPNVTDDGRTWYGVKWSEVAHRARAWWDKSGRREMWRTKRDLKNQDTGFNSGILRGDKWDRLDGRERTRVLLAFEETKVRREGEHAEMLRKFMIRNFPEELDQKELARHFAAAPNPEVFTDQLLEGKLDV